MHPKSQEIRRIPTGIEGLDDLVEGGFPERTVNLVSGPAGSGKTLLSMQYLYNGARTYGDVGLFLTLEEQAANLHRAMSRYGIAVEKYEKEGKLYIMDVGELRSECDVEEERETGLVRFDTLQDLIEKHLEISHAKRLVVDSLTAVGLHYLSVEELRREMFRFARFLRKKDMTSFLVTESIEGGRLTRYDVEQFVSDSLIVLGLEDVKGELRRTLTVRKMRFTKHDTAKHPFLITSTGMEVSAEEKVA